MRKQAFSIAATLIMILLALGSMEANSVKNQPSTASSRVDNGDRANTESIESSGSVASESLSTTDDPQRDSINRVYKMKETVHVGYTSYAVWKAWWSERLSSNEFLDQPADAAYLFVAVKVRNNDSKARMIPPFKLIDENGAEYDASSNGWAIEGSIGVLDSLNPGVTKEGFVVFDVPQNHTYKMKISGGYWSTEEAFIEIVDEAQEKREREYREAEENARLEAERREADKAREFEIDTAKWRIWVSANGKHRRHAKFVKFGNGVVTLENKDGKKYDVSLDKLSEGDQDFVKNRGWLKPILDQ